MGELNYIGWLAMLWIGFNLFVLYVTLKLGKGRETTIGLLDFIFFFWQLPVIVFNEAFEWNLPKWLGPAIWFAPLLLTTLINHSVVLNDETGWAVSLGRLVLFWGC